VKLYVVTAFEAEHVDLVGVFSTPEKAEEARLTDSQHNLVEEVELDTIKEN
jgi:hypothetical protein